MSREALPNNVHFKNYQIELTPNFDTFRYHGTEVITLSVIGATDTIVLNSLEIEVTSASVNKDGVSANAEISYDDQTQRVILKFPHVQLIEQAGEYELYVEFTGTHNDQMAGFYRSKYTDDRGVERYMVTTQFEATDARRAFPCGDEPSLKATFDITLNVPKHLTALSNMPVADEQQHPNDPNLKTVRFQRTPIMSTYLLAFYVGDVEYIENVIHKPVSKDPLKVRVYAPPGKAEQGQFALKLASDVLLFFSKYFGTEYPLPKMDLIAIPDFSAGAMENWGLVTFRTKYLLYEDGITSAKMKATIAYIICHELAHQWFGNLVTMEWWSDLWLNEGFATWVGWMATDHFFPEWRVWEMFIVDEHNEALELDRLSTSHPITNSVTKATQINEIFDTITYSKGACIIRMLVNYLGEESFKTGLQNYLKKFQYSNAKTVDLWNSLTAASGKNVSKMMSSWTDLMGYPLITVLTESNGRVKLEQHKYCDSTSNYRWTVPLNMIVPMHGGSPVIARIAMDDAVYSFDNSDMPWFKLNAGQTGFYMTDYDQTSLSNLAGMVKNGTLSPLDRTELIETLFSLASNGYHSVTSALNFIKAYSNETEYVVWASILSGIGCIKNTWFDNREISAYLDRLVYPMLRPILDRLGWESKSGESYQDTQLRTLAINALAKTDSVINEARSRFERYVAGDGLALSSDIRGSVFRLLVRANDEYFRRLMEYYQKVESNEVQTEIIRALGSTNNQQLLMDAFDFCYKSGKVRSQDAFLVGVAASVGYGQSRITNWNYIMNNWDTICKLYKGGKFLLGRLIGNSIDSLFDTDTLNKAEYFLDMHNADTVEIQNTLKQSFEKARKGLEWINRDTANIKELMAQSMIATTDL
jgi:aminopeptidase N